MLAARHFLYGASRSFDAPKQGSHPSDPSVGKRPFPVAHPPIKPIAPRTSWQLQGCGRCTCVNGAAETRRPEHVLHFQHLLRDHSAFRNYQRDTEAFVDARPLLDEIVLAVEHWPSQALPEGRKLEPVISQNLLTLTSPRLVNDDIVTPYRRASFSHPFHPLKHRNNLACCSVHHLDSCHNSQ
jgi:hypothetical protein